MYTILIKDDNTATCTKRERIMQRSKLVDTLQILTPQFYKGHEMRNFTVVMEYVLPISKRYESEILELSDEMYEDHLKYTVPFESKLTAEAGEIELQFTFICADLDENGKSIQRVRKISPCRINILPITAWSDIIPDSALGAIDQRIIALDSRIKEMNDVATLLNTNKADNLAYDENTSELQLTSNGKPIGDKVVLDDAIIFGDEDGNPIIPEGSDVVEF